MILYANLHIKEEIEEDNTTIFMGKSKKIVERDRTVDEIEQIPYFKTMINSGAHKLYSHKISHDWWDKEMFDAIEGKAIEIDDSIYDKYQFYNFGGETSIPVLNNWKLFSYNDYLEFIDEASTEQLRDIVNLRKSNPLKYYENMIKREYANAKR